MKLLPIAAICFLLGTAGGWHTRGPSPAEASTTTENARVSPRQARSRQKAQKVGVPADVAARLAPIYAAKTPAERLRATIHLARTLPVSEMARWFDNKWFDSRKGSDGNVFSEITRNRWMEEEPEGLLNHVRLRNWNNLNDIAERWARQDPDRALAYLDSGIHGDEKDRLKMAMLGGLTEARPDLVLAAAAEHTGNENYQWREIFKKLAHHDPSALENADLGPGMKSIARQALLSAALDRDFNGEITRRIGSSEGQALIATVLQEDYNLARKVSSDLLARMGTLPPELLEKLGSASHSLVSNDPLAWLNADLASLNLSPEVARRFERDALSHLTYKDPEEVLRRLGQSEFDQNQGVQLASQALNRLKNTDPAKAAEWQARLLATAPDPEYAAALQAQFTQRDQTKPATAADIFRMFEANTSPNSGWQLANTIQSATPAARLEFQARLKSMESHEVAALAHKIESRQLAPEIQAPLLSAAIQHPRETTEEDNQRGRNTAEMAAVNLATTWVVKDPAAASRWAASLPAGEARLWTLRNLVANWAPYDTPAANAWLATLPPADQTDVREFLKGESQQR